MFVKPYGPWRPVEILQTTLNDQTPNMREMFRIEKQYWNYIYQNESTKMFATHQNFSTLWQTNIAWKCMEHKI